MNQKGVKIAVLIGPNYAAGKDMLAGVKSTFKGEVVGEELTKWPDQLDFSAELTKAKRGKAGRDLCVLSGRRRRAVSQPIRAGRAKGQIPLYTAFTIDESRCRCRRIWRSACRARSNGSTTCRTRQNKKFVADFARSTPACVRPSTARSPMTPHTDQQRRSRR